MHLQQRLKKKEEGAVGSQATHSAKQRFLWEQEPHCVACATSTPPAQRGSTTVPGIVFVRPTFLRFIHPPCPRQSPATTPIATEAERKEGLTASGLN